MTLAEHAAADSIARSAPKAADNYVSRREVFFDPTGRRWQLTKFCALLLLLFVLFALASCERIQRPPTITTAGQALPLPHTIPANGLGYMPEIGTGPLVRVVRLAWSQGQYVAVDPFTNCILAR